MAMSMEWLTGPLKFLQQFLEGLAIEIAASNLAPHAAAAGVALLLTLGPRLRRAAPVILIVVVLLALALAIDYAIDDGGRVVMGTPTETALASATISATAMATLTMTPTATWTAPPTMTATSTPLPAPTTIPSLPYCRHILMEWPCVDRVQASSPRDTISAMAVRNYGVSGAQIEPFAQLICDANWKFLNEQFNTLSPELRAVWGDDACSYVLPGNELVVPIPPDHLWLKGTDLTAPAP